MESVHVPSRPNPFITEWLAGPTCRSIVYEAGELYQALYRSIVAKRTGDLAKSAHVSTEFEVDRWVGVMEVGNATAYYAASHEFGTTGAAHDQPNRSASTAREVFNRVHPGAHDLNTILNLMGTL